MNITRILLIFCLWAAGKASAQGFLQTYGPDASIARAVLQMPDGGYFLAGENLSDTSLFLRRTDAIGQTVWSNDLILNGSRALAACLAPDSGLVVLLENYQDTAQTPGNLVLKLSSSGTIVWQQTIRSTLPNYSNGLKDIISLSDGNFMLAGTIPGATTTIWLAKLASDGTLLWEKNLGANNKNVKKLVELPTGGVILAGGALDFYLAKVNLNGDLLWEKEYPQNGVQTLYDLLVTPEGGIAALGTSADNGQLKVAVLKTDIDGAELWFKSYYPFQVPSNLIPVINDFAQDDAGNFYIPLWGFDSDPLASDLELLKLDPNGIALWKNPLNVSGNPWDIIQTADNHLVITGDNNGIPTQALLVKTDVEGDFLSNKITGNVFRDDDVDCALTAGEPGLAEFIVQARHSSGNTFFKKTNPDGSYEIRVSEGDFELSARPSFAPPTLYAQCDTPTVTVLGTNQTVIAPDLAIQILGECPLLSVEISGGLLRRCTTSMYNVNWCNAGNLTAEDASLQIVLSPFLLYESSSIPLASQMGDTLNFLLNDVLPGACGTMNLRLSVSCNAQVGDALCAEAHIFPDSSCAPENFNWDGSKIEVSGTCNGTEIEFKIKNTGLGDMTQIAEYVIVEDQIMYMQAPLQLNAGQEVTTVRIPMVEDSCFALQVFPNQSSILSKPIAVVANCTANGNLSLLLNLPNNENDPAIAVHCNAVVGSFDPNDKVGFPLGLGEAHYLEREQDIEYRIRFQNTGNDTAFLIRIVDTLPQTLDPGSIRPIAASHAYTWDLSSTGILTFTFAQILLPDSTTNEPGSHGFVSFRASQKPGLPDGTLIENTASIYFDFNDPIVTNTWWHTIGRPATVPTQELPEMPNPVEVLVSPNPASETASFRLQYLEQNDPLRFQLFDPLGHAVYGTEFSGNTFDFKKKNLASGLYFWQIDLKGSTLARGRIVFN